MVTYNLLDDSNIVFNFGPEDGDQQDDTVDDVDWNDDGPKDDVIEKSEPTEEIHIPEE